MRLMDAEDIGEVLKDMLGRHCEAFHIAGSVRRRESMVNDLEVVCIPKMAIVGQDLFGYPIEARDPEFVRIINVMPKIKGDPEFGRYTRRKYVVHGLGEIEVDIFICNPRNLGLILAIRTGPAAFSHYLVKRARMVGLTVENGMLRNGSAFRDVPTEERLFSALKIPFVTPQGREAYVNTVAPELVEKYHSAKGKVPVDE